MAWVFWVVLSRVGTLGVAFDYGWSYP